MNFAPTEQPDNLPEGQPAEMPVAPPEYVAPVQPVTTGSRPSRRLVVAAVLAAAIGVGAVAVGLAAGGTPAAPAPAVANARGVLLGADTGAWTPPNGGAAAAPNAPGAGGPGMIGGPRAFGLGGMGPGGRMGGPGGFGSITITAISGSQLTLTTADGWTRTIDDSKATVTNAGQTVGASTLTVGESITFNQSRQSDGTYTITAIQVVLPHVDGTVKVVNDNTITVTQRDGTTKDIAVNGSTTYKLAGAASSLDAVTVGAQIDAQGTTTGGTFTASLVNIQPAMAGGTVTVISGDTITVKQRDGSTLTITIDPATTKIQVAGKTNATISDIAVNAIVMAQGTKNADGTFSATDVRAFTPGAGFGPGMRGGQGRMPGWHGAPGAQPAPTPAGTTN
jgi:hypothetical protein